MSKTDVGLKRLKIFSMNTERAAMD